jgi:hypothetical protein
LGPAGGQVVVAVGQQQQHRPVVVVGAHRIESLVAPGHDGRGAGIVGVGLVGLAVVQQPHPGREGRGDVDHGLASGDQLLTSRAPIPAAPWIAPDMGLEPLGPSQEVLTLMASPDSGLVDEALAAV